MSLIAVYTTVATLEEARNIANALVEKKLAACVQIHEIESVYQWDGEVQHAPEYRLMCKTTAAQYAVVETAIRALHAYQLPAIYALPVTEAFTPYAQWVEDSVEENSLGEK